MGDRRRRGETKELKKDQQVRREVLDELVEEAPQLGPAPKYRNPNRDQSRGDWDRSRRHTDELPGSDEGDEGNDALEPPE